MLQQCLFPLQAVPVLCWVHVSTAQRTAHSADCLSSCILQCSHHLITTAQSAPVSWMVPASQHDNPASTCYTTTLLPPLPAVPYSSLPGQPLAASTTSFGSLSWTPHRCWQTCVWCWWAQKSLSAAAQWPAHAAASSAKTSGWCSRAAITTPGARGAAMLKLAADRCLITVEYSNLSGRCIPSRASRQSAGHAVPLIAACSYPVLLADCT
jgi:hypothetical protein